MCVGVNQYMKDRSNKTSQAYKAKNKKWTDRNNVQLFIYDLSLFPHSMASDKLTRKEHFMLSTYQTIDQR